jgi:tetratricopeptide (TPR) repeat protein
MSARIVSLIALTGLAAGALPPRRASAEPKADVAAEASAHFQRGVALYTEADYRGALVEFRRAYEIAPAAPVLYNIGQTYFQLQDYAPALATLQRYLAETGPTAPHRREVEQTVETLRLRVGRLEITTAGQSCQVAIDDDVVGTTPLAEPVVVGLGKRKVTATCDGMPAESRFAEVAGGEKVKVAFTFAAAAAARPGNGRPASADDGHGLVTASWVATGVLGAGALTTGVIALIGSRSLSDARNSYPVSHADLADKAQRVSRFSLIADVLGVATLVTGGIALKLTLARSSTHEVHVAVVPGGLQLAGSFR